MSNQITGKDAWIAGVSCIQSWAISRVAQGNRYQASCTGGSTNTGQGNVNATGTINGVGLGALLPTGADLPFRGIVEVANPRSYTGTIAVTDTTFNFDVSGNAPVTWSSNFQVQGDITEDTNTSAGLVDTSLAEAISAKDAVLTLGVTAMEALQSATVTLRRPGTTYTDAGATYVALGNLEADVSAVIADKRLMQPVFEPNVLQDFKLDIGAVVAAHLSKCRFEGPTGITLDRSTGLVTCTMNGQFNAVEGTTKGFIVINDADIFGVSAP